MKDNIEAITYRYTSTFFNRNPPSCETWQNNAWRSQWNPPLWTLKAYSAPLFSLKDENIVTLCGKYVLEVLETYEGNKWILKYLDSILLYKKKLICITYTLNFSTTIITNYYLLLLLLLL